MAHALAIAIITLLVLVLRSHRWADAVGRVAARTVTKVVRPVDRDEVSERREGWRHPPLSPTSGSCSPKTCCAPPPTARGR